MHNIALKVNENAYEHLMYFLSNIKDDITIVNNETVEEDELTQELNKLDAYRKLTSIKKREAYEEIKHIQEARKIAKNIDEGTEETYPIEKLWDMLDD